MLKNNFKIAWRNLRRNRTYTIINVLGLALGITCSMVIYVFLRYELTFDAFHSQSDRIYRVVERNQTAGEVQYRNTTAYPLAEALSEEFGELEVAQAVGPVSGKVSFKSENGHLIHFEEDRILFARTSYFELFDFTKNGGLWIAGDPRTALENPNAVVLTQQIADRYFPSDTQYEALLGKTLTLNRKDILTITGIVKDPPKNTNLLFNIVIPYRLFEKNNPFEAANWSGNYQGTTFIAVPARQSATALEKEINLLKDKYIRPEDARRITYSLQPLKKVHTETLYGNSIGTYVVGTDVLWPLGCLAAFLILIACFNSINLTTAQTAKRIKEVGVRKTTGSSRFQLVTQFMSETLLVAVAAVALSVAGSYFILNFLNETVQIIPIELEPDFTFALFTFSFIILIPLLAGLYPALSLSRHSPLAAFKDYSQFKSLSRPKRRLSLRQGLIILQFGAAYLLVAMTLVIARQVYFMQNKDLGFTRKGIVTMTVPPQDPGKLQVFREQVLQNSSVKDISYSSGPPTTTLRQYGTNFRLDYEPESRMRSAEMKLVDLHYFDLYDLEKTAGNWLSSSNTVDGFNGFIVNEALVESLGLKPDEAIGKSLIINEGKASIVGVIRNFHNNSLQEKISPCLMFYWGGTNFYDRANIRLVANASDDWQAALLYMEKVWKNNFRNEVFKYEFVDDYIDRNYLVETSLLTAFRVFSIIAIFVSCLGLFGLSMYTAQCHTKEIGIRKVLGASIASILALLSKDFIKLVLIAITIVVPVGWWAMSNWLENFAYRIDLEWWMFALAGGLAMVIVLLTVSFQSLKAALMNPVKSLRSE